MSPLIFTCLHTLHYTVHNMPLSALEIISKRTGVPLKKQTPEEYGRRLKRLKKWFRTFKKHNPDSPVCLAMVYLLEFNDYPMYGWLVPIGQVGHGGGEVSHDTHVVLIQFAPTFAQMRVVDPIYGPDELMTEMEMSPLSTPKMWTLKDYAITLGTMRAAHIPDAPEHNHSIPNTLSITCNGVRKVVPFEDLDDPMLDWETMGKKDIDDDDDGCY